MQITKESISNNYHQMNDNFHELYMALAENVFHKSNAHSETLLEIHLLWEDIEKKFDVFIDDFIIPKNENN